MRYRHRISRWLAAALGAAALVPLLLAQSTGTITGRVYDERTGKSLEGAVVRIAGSNIQDSTGPDGRYSLPAQPGQATLEVDYVGLPA